MKKFLHLAKYNIIFNKMSIILLSFLALFITLISIYFHETDRELGKAMMQYSFYVIFMIFTGKMNSKNSMMFDIKHTVAMPLSKKEIILLKSFTDTFQFTPLALSFLSGFHLAFPEYHIFFVSIIFFMALALGNIVAFNKRIDFSRMQHSKASFKNSFLFLHKYLELFIQVIIIALVIGVIVTVFEKNIFMQEYSFALLLVVALFIAFSQTLKMLKDETRSYFIMRRDLFRIAGKGVLVIVPLLIFHQAYKKEGVLASFGLKEQGISKLLVRKIKKLKNFEKSKVLLSIARSDRDSFEALLADGVEVPWDMDIAGAYPPHLAALVGDKKILERILELRPDVLDLPGKNKKKTPLHAALGQCHLEASEFLIQKGADINSQDINGNTPIIYAAQSNCFGGVFLLNQYGADLKVKNIKGKNILAFLSRESGMRYILDKDKKNKALGVRTPAPKSK